MAGIAHLEYQWVLVEDIGGGFGTSTTVIGRLEPLEDVRDVAHAFTPFGGGRRTCIGREFARFKATLALTTIGQRFDLEWTGDKTDMAIEPEMTTKTQNGLPMTLRQR